MVAAAKPDTFDLISVQIYEGWSRADQALLARGAPASEYLRAWAARLTRGWPVDFGDGVSGLPRARGARLVRARPEQLVLALSRGSGDGSGKSAFVWPEDAGIADASAPPSERFRGCAFWNIASEGGAANGTNTTLAFSPELNRFLHTRPTARRPAGSSNEPAN